jgi:hypothetical protein
MQFFKYEYVWKKYRYYIIWTKKFRRRSLKFIEVMCCLYMKSNAEYEKVKR